MIIIFVSLFYFIFSFFGYMGHCTKFVLLLGSLFLRFMFMSSQDEIADIIDDGDVEYLDSLYLRG